MGRETKKDYDWAMSKDPEIPPELNPVYPWIRSRLLEGTWPGGPDVGAWPASGNRVQRAWGLVERSDWSYRPSDGWPPTEPPGLDQLAKKHRNNRYIRIRSAADCEIGIASGIGVVGASFDIVSQDWGNAPNGYIPVPAEGVIPDVGHCVPLMIVVDEHGRILEESDSVDEKNRRFGFPNSWGVGWGDRGWGYMTYDYFDQFMNDAWFIDAFPEPPLPPQSGIRCVHWAYIDIFGRKNFVIEVNDWDRDERIGWCFFVEIGTVLEVEEFFVMPAYRRQGYGTGLMQILLDGAKDENRPILFWISHPDWNANQRPITQAFLEKFGFAISGRDVRWASAKAALGMAPPMVPSGRPLPAPLAPMGARWRPE
jgi:GNAT superfamily N-acetyltransferase